MKVSTGLKSGGSVYIQAVQSSTVQITSNNGNSVVSVSSSDPVLTHAPNYFFHFNFHSCGFLDYSWG
jgi:hypothetical protein